VKAARPQRIVPHPGPVPEDVEPTAIAGHKSGALRAAVFGVQDGLVSNLALIMAVAGAGLEPGAVVVAGVAGLLAGAFSMAAGEYQSMRVQREIYERLIHLEAHELATDPEGEHEELVHLFERRGIPRGAAETAATAMMADPRQALEVHAREELGLDPDELGSPWAAGGSSMATFALGAFVPLLPFLFMGGATAASTSATLSLVTLFVVGAWLSVFTGRKWFVSGGRMMLIGGGAALVTFLVGRALGVAVA
jgi:VIT1/CCC1 family predicted Fe2+/Mn2+ transporter